MKPFWIVFSFLILLSSTAEALDEQGLRANEIAQPTSRTIGLTFSATNNNLGYVFWADPQTSSLASYSVAGLAGRYYLTPTVRLQTGLTFFVNSWNHANQDTAGIWGAVVSGEAHFSLLRTGPINLYAGPILAIGLVSVAYNEKATAVKTSTSGQTYTVGGTVGAEYFVHPQFSLGASAPLVYRLVATTTDQVQALAAPSQNSLFGLGSASVDLSFYW